MPPDKARYERSQIDWKKLNAYAGRVARETSKPKHVRVVRQQGRRPKTMYRERLFRSPAPYEVIELYDETEHINTDYWVLETRYRAETTIRKDGRTVETEYTEFCLSSDGTLFKHFWEEVEASLDPGPGREPINGHYTRPLDGPHSLSDRDVMLFDYWPDVRPLKRGNETIKANHWLDPRWTLRHHAKGVGLSKALGELLK